MPKGAVVTGFALLVFAVSCLHAAAQEGIDQVVPDPAAFKAIATSKGSIPEAERLARLIAEFRRANRAEPVRIEQTAAGLAVWRSRRAEQVRVEQQTDDAFLAAVRTLEVNRLSESDRLDAYLLTHHAEVLASGVFRNFDVWPDFHRPRPPYAVFASRPQTVADFQNVIAWMRGVPFALEETRTVLRAGVRRGVVATRPEVEDGIASVQAATPSNGVESPYLRPFGAIPESIDAAQREALQARAQELYRTLIIPEYARHVAFLRDEYLPHARPVSGLSAVPGGRERYRSVVRQVAGVDSSPSELHQRALDELRRLHVGLKQFAQERGFRGSGAEYLTHVRTQPECGALEDDSTRTSSVAFLKRVEQVLPKLFDIIPRTPYEVVIDTTLPVTAGGAFFTPGSLAQGRVGKVRLAPVKNACVLPNLLLHDGFPGHLLQMHTAAEGGDVSDFRRTSGASLAYVEGWAHYAAGLAGELELDMTPATRAERLGGEVMMAIRAALDTGIHWHGWSLEEAKRFYREQAPWAPAERVEAETNAALRSPGNRMSYFVGKAAFDQMRTNAAKAAGSQFDVRRFHREVLRLGAVPPRVLERHMREWRPVVLGAP